MHSTSYQHSKTKKAIPFITKTSATSKYQITKQAQDLLKKIDKPISVVSVAGLYRTGKSYLLNRVILDQKNVFGVGPTVNPCTKGLWMWIQPDPTTTNRDLLVIDTQGLGALDEESNHDMKIFCLAVLLSTTFIYNSVGSIDQNALQTLSLVLNLVANIDQDSNSNKPNFIWVVRDFSLQLINGDGVTLSPKEYLEMALTSNIKQQQKASIRKTITNAFQNRDCFTLVKPLIDELKLQNLDEIPMDELRPQFISQSIELRNRIKSGLRPFTLQSNSQIRGKQYILIVKKYVDAINLGAVPNIVDTWAFIKEQKCRQALDETKKIYTERINNRIMTRVPMKKNQAEELWGFMKEQIRQCFTKNAFYDANYSNAYKQNPECFDALQDFLKNAESHILRVNNQQGQKYLKSMLIKDYQAYCKKLFSCYYNGFEEFSKDLNTNFKNGIIQKYSQKIDNIQDQTDRFIASKLIDNFPFFQKNLKEEIKRLTSLKEELQNTMSQQLSQINDGRDKERRKLQERIFSLQKQVSFLQNQKYQLSENQKSQQQLSQNKLLILKRKSEQSAHTIEQLTQEILRLNSCQTELKQKLFLQNKQFQKEKALFQQKEEYMQKKINEIQNKNIDLESRMNETGGKFESEKKNILRQYQDKITMIEGQNRSLLDRNSEAQSKIVKLTNELNCLTDEIQMIKKNTISEKKSWEQRILKAESNKKATALQRQLQQQNEQLRRDLSKANEKVNQYSSKMKSTHDQYKQLQANSQKQIAIHCQKIQFQEIELKDFENRYNQLKQSYQKALQSLQDSSKSLQHNSQLKMLQIRNQYQKQIEGLQSDYEQKQKVLKKQLQISQRIVEQLQLQSSLDKKNQQTKQKEWKQSNNMLQGMCKKLEDKIKSSQKDYEDIYKEKEAFYLHRIKKLEQENDETKEKASQQTQEVKRKSEQALSILKHYSEIEKQQWEKRLHDDKDKADKKIANIRQDYQKRIQEDKASYEEQISDLQEKLAHMDRVFNQRLQNMQYDHDIQLQKLTNNFTQVKVEKQKKIALLQQELQINRNNFERELSTKIKQFQHTLTTTRQNLQRQHEQKVSQLNDAFQHLKEKYQALKKQNRQLEQNNLKLKNQSDNERALHKQKQKSFEIKIIELENKLEEELKTYNSVIEKINQKNSMQRANLNKEIQKQNNEILELQRTINQQERDFENNVNRYQMKIKYLSEQKQKSKEQYEDFMHKFEVTVKNLTKTNNQLKNKKHQEITQAVSVYENQIKNQEQNFRKIQKDQQDRIARLATENKSLKQRIVVLQLQKSGSSTRINSTIQQETIKKHEKRVQEYKELLEKQKDNCRKLREQNNKLRMELEGSVLEKSQASIYYERPSFSEVSNSRISQPYQSRGPPQYNQGKNNQIYYNNDRRDRQNRMDRSATRKFNNTPLIQKKSRVVDVNQFSGMNDYTRKSKY